MELFLAICIDRHIDEHVRVFSKDDLAIGYCKEFAKECKRDDDELEEEELTSDQIEAGWLYYATYGVEGDNVRVERTMLDNLEDGK